MSTLIFFLCGAAGALMKDIIQDGKLRLPKKINDDFILGFLGGVITGGCAGMFIDGNPITAFLAGYAGTSAIENLLLKPLKKQTKNKELIKAIIKHVGRAEGVNPDLAVRVAECESGLDPVARNVNKSGSIDRGLFQINNKYHPEITDKMADDIVLSTRFFCKAFKEGHLDWWNASKKCWDKK